MRFFSNTTLENQVCRPKSGINLYPFGMEMPGRKWVHSDYRYGNQGAENDNEIFDGAQNLGLREYDERIGRMFSKDPFSCFLFNKSPYSYAGNSPITFIDYNGGFQLSKRNQRKYPQLNRVLRTISNIANDNPTLSNPIISSIIRAAGLPMDNNSLEEVLQMLSFGSGPLIVLEKINDYGNYTDGEDKIKLNSAMVTNLERYKKASGYNNPNYRSSNDRNGGKGPSAFLGAFLVIIHESTHYIDWESDGNTAYNAFLTNYSKTIGLGYDLGDYATRRLAGVGVRGILDPGRLMQPYASEGDFRTFRITTIHDMWLNNSTTTIPGLPTLNLQNYNNFINQFANGKLLIRNGNGFNYVNPSGVNQAISAGKMIIQGIKTLFSKRSGTRSRYKL